MPLEISEIGVHISVRPDGPFPPPPVQVDPPGQALTPAQQETIVNRCVQQVLRTLRQTQDR